MKWGWLTLVFGSAAIVLLENRHWMDNLQPLVDKKVNRTSEEMEETSATPLSISMPVAFSNSNPVAEERTSETFPRTEHGSLAIHMVIVPFLRYGANENATLEREMDYKLCLTRNLAHPQVQQVHILTINSTDTSVRFREFTNNSKLVIAEVKSVDVARDPWDYISQNLVGKDVIFANADIYLGKGYDKIDPTIMNQQKIMYSLSRHVAPEHYVMCKKKSSRYYFKDLCSWYKGAHDMFMFRLHEALPEEFYQKLPFNLISYGMENRVIWLFQNVLKYCVLNPCSILEIFHYHCSSLRNNKNSKVRRAPNRPVRDRASAQPVKELYCY